MSRRLAIAIAVLSSVVVVGLVVGLRAAADATKPEKTAAVDANIPAFTPFAAPPLKGTTLDGKPFDLADYRGTPVVVNFWATWCGPCRREIPAIASFAKNHPDIQVIGVNYQDDAAAARTFAEETGASWPSVVDDGPIGAAWKVPGLPATFFIDADGQVVDRGLGEVSEQLLVERTAGLTAP